MAKTKKKKLEKREKTVQARKIGVEAKYNYILIGLVLGISILYIIATLYYSGGYFFLPVDNSFSYFHYAKQLSAGHPFQYNFGDAPTTGVRSLLYTIILAPGFFIGLTGDGIIYYSFFLGMLFLFLSAWLIFRIGEGLFDRNLGLIAGLLFLLNGPISWGYLSGTEIGLFGTVILATLYFFLREQDGNYKKTVILGSLLAIAHPEGAVLSILLVVVLIVNIILKGEIANLKGVLIFIPAFVGIGSIFLNLILTGSLFSTFLQSKSPLFSPSMPLLEILARAIKFYAYILKEIFGGFNGAYTEMISPDAGQTATYFAPFAFLFFLFGSLPLAVKEIYAKRLGINLLMVSWFFIGIGLVAITFPTDYSWNMSLIPYYPLFLLGAVVGIYHFSLMITNMGTTISLKQTFYGLSSFFIVFSLFSISFFVVAYGKICKDNYHQKMGLVKWIRENIPADVSIAMDGINILRYYENRNFIDLCGVGTLGLAKAYQNGVGSIFEWLEEKKLYPSCFVLDRLDLTHSGLLKTELYSARVVGVRPIEPINVYQADWSLANKGDEPVTSMDDYKLVDKIDVANLDSEAGHNYRFWEAEPGLNSTTYVYEFPCGNRQIIDGGRSLSGGESMVVKTQPGQEMKIVLRTTGALKLDVVINGKYCCKWVDETNPGNVWSESSVTLPGKWVTSTSTKVHIEVRDKQQDTYSVAYYWFYQK